MIGLDTNVLARLIVADDPAQTDRAARLIANQCSRDDPGFIDHIVLAELAWVLDSVFGYGRKEIAAAIADLSRSTDLRVEDQSIVLAALADYESGHADFADGLISRVNSDRGCTATATFDRKAARLDGFVAVP